MPATLERLTDDALLMVMQYLSPDDLLACRLVCKRLCGLALLRDVWRHQTLGLDGQGQDKPCVCAVLRLAPCLNLISYDRDDVHTAAFTTTTCAVRDLLIAVDKKDYALAALAVRNQQALGRLRHVWVTCDEESKSSDAHGGAAALLRTLAACPDLETLDVTLPAGSLSPLPLGLRRAPTSSLTSFKCVFSKESESSFVHAVLAGHADTLEEVDLGVYPYCSDEMAAALVSTPNLRKLKCAMFLGMERVQAPEKLTELSLIIPGLVTDKAIVRGVAALLRRAVRLRELSIDLFGADDSEDLSDLLEALASSGGSLVALSVVAVFDIQPVVHALPRLPTLRVLEVLETWLNDGRADDLLLAITPDTAPALRSLRLDWDQDQGLLGEECTHAWLHGDTVKKILTVNPALHIDLRGPKKCKRCEVCKLGCHKQSTKWWGRHPEMRPSVGLFSHDPDNCSSNDHFPDRPEHHTWIYVCCSTA